MISCLTEGSQAEMDCLDSPEVEIYRQKNEGLEGKGPTWLAEPSRAAAGESSNRLGDKSAHQEETGKHVSQ